MIPFLVTLGLWTHEYRRPNDSNWDPLLATCKPNKSRGRCKTVLLLGLGPPAPGGVVVQLFFHSSLEIIVFPRFQVYSEIALRGFQHVTTWHPVNAIFRCLGDSR